jgi:hypothetical protein
MGDQQFKLAPFVTSPPLGDAVGGFVRDAGRRRGAQERQGAGCGRTTATRGDVDKGVISEEDDG